MSKLPQYSICMCNYNMADTIVQAIVSIIDQLDDDYELVIVDDGSTDDSISKLEGLVSLYRMLRLVKLDRDNKRMLGETRNISIREARGCYVLLHIDADDVWDPYIKDFVSVFHEIEKCKKIDFLLSGRQINMAKREFLLSHGPYKNIYRGEDNELFHRLAGIGAYLPIKHRIFRTRLVRDNKIMVFKIFNNIWSHLCLDLVRGNNRFDNIIRTIHGIFSPKNDWSMAHRCGRILLFIPSVIFSLNKDKILMPINMCTHEEFVHYRESVGGTYSEIMKKNNCNPSLYFLRANAKKIFRDS